jgi:hypothetical protein
MKRLSFERVDHKCSEEARAETRQARLTTGAEAPTLAASSFCQFESSHPSHYTVR